MVPIAVPVPRQAPSLRRRVPLRRFSRASSAGLPTPVEAQPLQYALQKRSLQCMPELTVRQAREMLTAWVAEWRSVAARRDKVVRAAVEAGLSKAEVHRLTGIARTTIDRIVGPASGEGCAR
jgi:hypothetical protein